MSLSAPAFEVAQDLTEVFFDSSANSASGGAVEENGPDAATSPWTDPDPEEAALRAQLASIRDEITEAVVSHPKIIDILCDETWDPWARMAKLALRACRDRVTKALPSGTIDEPEVVAALRELARARMPSFKSISHAAEKLSSLEQPEDARLLLCKLTLIEQNTRDSWLQRHLGFVHSIAFEYDPGGRYHQEIFAVGSLGLVKAADDFNLRAPNRFITYATWHVRNEIIQAGKNLGFFPTFLPT